MSLKNEVLELTSSLNLLYVEDERESREMIKSGIFGSLFSNVYAAENGKKGVEIFQANVCDLIITDLHMPEMDGIEMIKKIREIDNETPIIILSAHSDVNYFLNSIDLGVDGYILKPLREQNIINTIKKCAKNIALKRELEFRRKAELEKKDIVIDYQKHKIKNYKALLEELLIIKYINKKNNTESKKEGYTKSDSLLNSEELELLRRRREYKVSANEYISDLNNDLLEEIEMLGEVEKDMSDALSDFFESRRKEHLDIAIRFLDEYARNIKLLIEFEDLACAINSLVAFLSNYPEEEIVKNGTKINLYLQNIFSDLREWRRKIFITKETLDIHYLDSSLFSSTLQLQLSLTQNGEDEGNDLELF